MSRSEENQIQERMQSSRKELLELLYRLLPEDGSEEVLPGFFLARSSKPREGRAIYEPALCFIIQGGKRVLLGEEVYWYDPVHYLIFTLDLPLVFKVEEASEEKPYLGFRLTLDPALIASVIMEEGLETKKSGANVKAIGVSSIDAGLLDAAVRMIRLVDAPKEQKVLFPLIYKEIIFRLLLAGHGPRLSHLLTIGADRQRISQAIGHLRENFNQPLKVENIADQFGMSVSGFHHHFKNMTAMSPIQFQKQLRLQEARRLMMGEDLDAATAGFRVGYENPAHFSREYKKLFGEPPQRDIAILRKKLEQ